MKNQTFFWLTCLFLAPLALVSAEVAQIRLYCQSLRFQTATTQLVGLDYTLQMTSLQDEINGEVFPLDTNQPPHRTYGSGFILTDPTAIEPINGFIAFDDPPPTDANGDGFP